MPSLIHAILAPLAPRSRQGLGLLVSVLAALTLLVGCEAIVPSTDDPTTIDPGDRDPVQAQVALTNVPDDTFCVRFRSTVVTSMTTSNPRVYDQLASVAPGAPASVAIKGLPFDVSLS